MLKIILVKLIYFDKKCRKIDYTEEKDSWGYYYIKDNDLTFEKIKVINEIKKKYENLLKLYYKNINILKVLGEIRIIFFFSFIKDEKIIDFVFNSDLDAFIEESVNIHDGFFIKSCYLNTIKLDFKLN